MGPDVLALVSGPTAPERRPAGEGVGHDGGCAREDAVGGDHLAARVAAWVGRPGDLAHTTFHLTLSTGATALLGLGFWAVAARLFAPQDVGNGSAEIAAMSLVAGFAQLNLAHAFVRYLPPAGADAARAVRLGYGLSLGTAAVVASAYVLSPLARTVVPAGWGAGAVFVVSVGFWTVFILQDGVLTGLSRAAVVPVENVAFGVAKLGLLPVMLVLAPASGVFFAWTVPVLAAVVAISAYLLRRAIPQAAARAVPTAASPLPRGVELRSFLSAEYVHSLVSAAASFLLPLLIVRQLGAVAEAHFYIPWLIYLTFSNLMANVSSGLIVESAARGRSPATIRRAFALMAAIAAVGLGVAVGLPGPLLGLLSPGYASSGAGMLRFVGLALPFVALGSLLVSQLWIERRIWGIVAVRVVQSAVLVGGTELFLHRFGIEAAGFAVLADGALVSLVGGPIVWRWYRRLARDAATRVAGVGPVELPPVAPPPVVPDRTENQLWD